MIDTLLATINFSSALYMSCCDTIFFIYHRNGVILQVTAYDYGAGIIITLHVP